MGRAVALPRLFGFAMALLLACLTAACWPDSTPTPVSKCATEMFPSYNPKDKEQCIAACIKCDRGVMTTCATACSLKGAK
jgi:hypothetical protein